MGALTIKSIARRETTEPDAADLAAAIAAVIVGLRQAGISAQQITILSKQVALDELKLRSDLFDRRAHVYQCVGIYIEVQKATADIPDVKTRNDFLVAINRSRLLFNDGVHKSLKDIWDRTGQFAISKHGLAQSTQRNATTGRKTSTFSTRT